MTKDREHLTSAHPLKFNDAQIKLDLNGIVLTKKSHVGGILLVTDHIIDSTNSKRITRKKLLPYVASVYQPKAFLTFSKLLKQWNSCQMILPY